jgi:predicted transcriptional regulator
MLTVAIRGPLAAKMRELAETTGMSLAKLLGDMVLIYAGERETG